MNVMPSNAQRGDKDGPHCNEEERYDRRKGELFKNQQRFPKSLVWDFEINTLGVKDDTTIHFCGKCELPIRIYGRMIPCKHVFCYDCAISLEKEADKLCPGCNNPVQRIERYMQGSLFICSTVEGCKRTYLSQRDLQAHINLRHLRIVRSVIPTFTKSVPPPPLGPLQAEIPEGLTAPVDNPQVSHVQPEGAPAKHNLPLEGAGTPAVESALPPLPPPPSSNWVGQKSFQLSTRNHKNLITVPILDDSDSGTKKPRLPVQELAYQPTGYEDRLVISHPQETIPPWLYYGLGPPSLPPPPAPPALPVNHPMQHSTSFGYSQAPLPVTPVFPPVPPPLGKNNIAQMPANGDLLPLGPPPPPQQDGLFANVPGSHHNYPYSWLQFTENQGTLNPAFTQPGGMIADMWPEPIGLLPPQPPTFPVQGPPQGLYHVDQTGYNPYYQ